MQDPVLHRRVHLQPWHRPTGKTRHYRGGRELPVPAALWIVRYDGDPGFYLFYLDDRGREMTDTYHDTLEGALSQAKWEFGVGEDEWEEA